MHTAVVLFSGGMDSLYCLHHARSWCGNEFVSAIFFNYGQRNNAQEMQAARFITDRLQIHRCERDIRDITWPSGSLIGGTVEEFEDYNDVKSVLKGKIEPAFVPLRNQVMLSIASCLAIDRARENGDHVAIVFIGLCKEDAETVPDCSLAFLRKFSDTSRQALGEFQYLVVQAPMIGLPKYHQIKTGMRVFGGYYTDLAFTHTSYIAAFPPRRDHASLCRANAFVEAGVPDPLIVRAYKQGMIPKLPDIISYTAHRDKIEALPSKSLMTWADMYQLESLMRE